jgi:LexA DNA binding domain
MAVQRKSKRYHIKMTPAEKRVFTAITELNQEDPDVNPSYEEVARRLGLKAVSNIHDIVKSLRQKGKLPPAPKNRARTRDATA